MRYIISYDISDNSIRRKLVNILEKFGERVQYSVFEFELNDESYENLISDLKVNSFFRKRRNCKITIYKIKPHLVKQIKRYGYKSIIDSKYVIM
ncbi:MAG: CRISPR-associated endonuclease Cas2 [Patescibacteria group bacterium]|nr:CRISPR-associated endonuclease Cas2 [Patescibacteria group bacterium]